MNTCVYINICMYMYIHKHTYFNAFLYMYIAWYDRRPSRSASARRMISSSSFGATFTCSRFSTTVANFWCLLLLLYYSRD